MAPSEPPPTRLMTPTESALERGDPRVADQAKRQGPFWDMIEGRAPAPPAAKLLGWKLVEIHPEQGRVRVEFEARAEFLNPVGTVQGGILAAMLDDTMGPAVASVLGGDGFGQTLEL